MRRSFRRIRKMVGIGARRCYDALSGMGKGVCIFLALSAVFVLTGIILIISIPRKREKEAQVYAEMLAAMTTAVPSPEATAEPTPTPEPAELSWVKRGQEGDEVEELQKRLMKLGYLDIDEPTSKFGAATQTAVKLFQRQHGLQQDGIVGEETKTILFSSEAQHYVMREGEEGDDILAFQHQLKDLGYLSSKQITGYFGTDTVEAVKYFQRRNHLKEDGKAGEKTIEVINSPDARVTYVREQEIIKEKKKAAAKARKSSAEGRIDTMISVALKQVGKRYSLGKNGPDLFDCSGLAYYCLQAVNVYCRRLSAAGFSQMTSWTKINSMGSIKKGDLLFYKSDDSSSVGHVAIYIGGGMMVDASSSNGKVMKRSCTGTWCRRNFVFARRPIT